jgi:hypothetical protein
MLVGAFLSAACSFSLAPPLGTVRSTIAPMMTRSPVINMWTYEEAAKVGCCD